MTNETKKRYFGTPGVCFDIDGDLWHEPGSCPNCGYEEIPAPAAPARADEPHVVPK